VRQTTPEHFDSRPKLTDREAGVSDEHPGPTGSSVIITIHRLQAQTERLGVFDKFGELLETQLAEPNQQMRSSLMCADFNVRIGKAPQCFDCCSSAIGDLLDLVTQVVRLLAVLDEGCECCLLHDGGPEIIHPFRSMQIVGYRLWTYDVAEAQC
jgi:hypothetical protein